MIKIPERETCLLAGADGLLGRALRPVLEGSYRLAPRNHREMDITDRDSVDGAVAEVGPEVIVNAAALADVDRCQREPEPARAVNRDGPLNLARAADRCGARLVHFSTDYVFDGAADRPYNETDPTNPLSEYGRSKLAGEEAIRGTIGDHLIVRTAWLFGPGRETLVDRVADQILKGEAVGIVSDQVSAPTYSLSLARATLLLLQTGLSGLFHYVGRGRCSRYEMALYIAEWLRSRGFVASVAVVSPIKSQDLDWAAPRPTFTPLSVERFERAANQRVPLWQEMLSDYLESRLRELNT